MPAQFTYTWKHPNGTEMLPLEEWAERYLMADELYEFREAQQARDLYLKSLVDKGLVNLERHSHSEIQTWRDKPAVENHMRRFMVWEGYANRCAFDQGADFSINVQLID